MRTFTAYIEFDPETKTYVGIVPGIPGAHTVGDTLDELQANLKEVLELILEDYEENLDDLPRFIGVQQIEVQALASCPSSIFVSGMNYYCGLAFRRSVKKEVMFSIVTLMAERPPATS